MSLAMNVSVDTVTLDEFVGACFHIQMLNLVAYHQRRRLYVSLMQAWILHARFDLRSGVDGLIVMVDRQVSSLPTLLLLVVRCSKQ